MTKVEQIANNLYTIVIARVAMIVTPFLLWFFWETNVARIVALEQNAIVVTRQLNDHEGRLTIGKVQREEFQRQATEQFREISLTLKEVSSQINLMNGNVIRLQSTLENQKAAQ